MKDPERLALAKGPVRVSRVADVVADRIRDLIIDGTLADGDRLPPLDALLEEFSISGPSMREALRVLESEGLITVKRGSVGGSVVHRPEAETAAYTMALVLRSRGTQLHDVFDALALLEPMCAMLCARRADRKKAVVPELRKVNKASRGLIDGEGLAFSESMMAFHKTVVQRCGNDTVTLMTGILESIWLVNERTWAKATSARGELFSGEQKLQALEFHEEICRLIDSGKDHEVEQAMTEHNDVGLIYGEWIDPSQRVDAQAIRQSR
jgi:GntR family transcriptional repressor for pyruvate dehydrogenase complex